MLLLFGGPAPTPWILGAGGSQLGTNTFLGVPTAQVALSAIPAIVANGTRVNVRQAAVGATASISANGQGQIAGGAQGPLLFFWTQSGGLATSADLTGTASVQVAGQKSAFRASALAATASVAVVPQRVVIRSAALAGTANIAAVGSAGTPSTVTYDSATVTYDSIGVTYEGVVEAGTRERAAELSATAAVAVAGRRTISRQVAVSATAIFHARVVPEAGFAFAIFGLKDRPDYFEEYVSPDSIDAEDRPSMFVLAGRPSSFSETDQVRE